MLPLAIVITLLVVVGIGLIMLTESQNVAITQKENAINVMHSNKEKETIQATHNGKTFSFKNPENTPVNIKYLRIVDDSGNLITRIPYTARIQAFANSSLDLSGVIPSQYLK